MLKRSKKKLASLGIVLALLYSFAGSAFALPAFAHNSQVQEVEAVDISSEKLKEMFSEYALQIDLSDRTNKKEPRGLMRSSQPQVIYNGTRNDAENDLQYSLILYDDNTYLAAVSRGLGVGGYSWTLGDSSSGSGYTSYTNALLRVRATGAITVMDVFPFSYTFVNGGYSSISNAGQIQYYKCTSAWQTGSFTTEIKGPTSTKLNANASGPAYANYTGYMVIGTSGSYANAVAYVKIEVGSGTIGVYLNNVKL